MSAKTRKVTEMGRLVTRSQLQSAANQIGAHILGVMQKLEDAHDARLKRIEERLGIIARPQLVKDEAQEAHEIAPDKPQESA